MNINEKCPYFSNSFADVCNYVTHWSDTRVSRCSRANKQKVRYISYVNACDKIPERFPVISGVQKAESLRKLARYNNKDRFWTTAVITYINQRRSKLSDKPWVTLRVSDGSATVKALVFPNAFSEHGKLCVKGTPLLICGHILKTPPQKESGGYTIVVDKLYRLPEEAK